MNYEVISDYSVNLSEEEIMPGYTKVKIKVDFGKKCSPEPVVIKWSIPGAGAAAIWQPLGGQATMIRPDWIKTQTPSRLALGMPIQVYYSQGGENVMCIALSDVKTPCVLSSGIYEENANINWELKLFSELVTPIKRYETELIIDRRKIPFYESIEDVRKIWENGQDKYVPEDAKLPLYSTWYSMHQELECEDLIKELEKAREYGMKNVIIDDGWQTEDKTRGYSFCGDWIPSESKVGKMRELTDRIHALGMKCMLWFSIPFVGEESLVYDKFKDKFVRKIKDAYDEKYTGVLDPRYPEVRDYLISTYEKAISEWGYDGVKLDFVDAIQFEGSADIKDGMDYASLEDATEALLESTYRRLRSINNDVLIEYRQPYIGPVMCEYHALATGS